EFSAVIYDTRLNREIHHPNKETPIDRAQRAEVIAQLRFEDGQYSGYPEEEWKALTAWLKEQKDLASLEKYFLNDVLKSRPRDRELYRFSPLGKLIGELKGSR